MKSGQRSHHVVEVEVVGCTVAVDSMEVELPHASFRLFACLVLSTAKPWSISRLAATLYPHLTKYESINQTRIDIQALRSSHPLFCDIVPIADTIYIPLVTNLYRIESLITRIETLTNRIRSGDESFETASAILSAIVQGVQFVLPGIAENWADAVRQRVEKLRQDAMLFALKIGPEAAEAYNNQLITASRGTSVIRGVPGYRRCLFGRDKDLKEICDLLQKQRVVTLLGESGVGKTALAAHTLDNLPSRLQGERVVTLNLRGVSAHDVLLSALLDRMNLSVAMSTLRADADIESLIRGLLGNGVLLVDNAEGLDAHSIHLLTVLSRHATIFVTSQKLLGIPGEVYLEVEPLAVPGLEEGEEVSTAQLLLRYPSAALLAARRWESKSNRLSPRALARTLRATRGVPLAIELVARQEQLIRSAESASQIFDPLETLLSSLPQAVYTHLMKLSLWRSGIPAEVTDESITARLIDAALLLPRGHDLYQLPTPVQDWAHQKIEQMYLWERTALLEDHRASLEQLTDERLGLVTLDVEEACRKMNTSRAAHLITRTSLTLRGHGRPLEALRLLEQLHEDSLNQLDLAEVLDSKGRSLLLAGRWREAKKCLERALPIWRQLQRERDIARCLSGLGTALDELENGYEALSLYKEAAEIFQTIGDHKASGALHANMGAGLIELGRFEDAKVCFEISVKAAREYQPAMICNRLLGVAEAAALSSLLEPAVKALTEAIQISDPETNEIQRARAILLWSLISPSHKNAKGHVEIARKWHSGRGILTRLSSYTSTKLDQLFGDKESAEFISAATITEIISEILTLH